MKLLLPPSFVRDCVESDCDIGAVTFDYRGATIEASDEQVVELRDRAAFYASPDGPDAGECARLKASAGRVLRALRRYGIS